MPALPRGLTYPLLHAWAVPRALAAACADRLGPGTLPRAAACCPGSGRAAPHDGGTQRGELARVALEPGFLNW